jgi:ribosomal-protein-alanine N-acetyltransferase
MRESLPENIVTDRLQLRPWKLGDIEAVFSYARDPEWSRYLRVLPRPYTEADAERFIARQLLLDWTEHPAWAVVLEGRAIGGVNLGFRFDHGFAELGYAIGRGYWNRSLCTEAARGVVDAAFATHADLNRIQARADVENRASQRVMEKLGMQQEGVHRMCRIERGETIDEAWFALLRPAWLARTDRSSAESRVHAR